MNLKGRTVAVTGAGGFIGSHLVERLVAEGADVRALVHYRSTGTRGWLENSECAESVTFAAGDIADHNCVDELLNGADMVFHLAALIAIPYSYTAYESYLRVNGFGTLNVLKAARKHNLQLLVHTSTSEVYGTAQFVPINESHPLQAQSPYAASKIAADKLVESFHRSFGLPTVTIRPFNTFGPRQSARAVIPTIVTQALSSDVVRLGNLSPTRDLNYVQNTVDGFLAATSKPEALGKTVQLGSQREISIGALAELIVEMLDKKVEVVSTQERKRPDGSEVNRLIASTDLAGELLGWKPNITLEDGLAETIRWIRDNQAQFRASEYSI